MLLVSLLTSSLAPSIRIQRVEADSNLLFPENSQRLTKFMMDATYGAVRPFSPAWAQRSVLDATSNSDFFGRLAYYEEMRAAGQPRGAIFAAERESDGALCGFADVGVSLWLPNDRAFRLPQDRDLRRLAATGVGTDGQRKPGVELRPYLSNLVVDASMRRSGVGRSLMAACEEYAANLEPGACSIAGAPGAADQLWLEVTTSNRVGMDFYRALGYAEVGARTAGSEVQRASGGGGFTLAEVQRCVMRKPLPAPRQAARPK